MEFQAIEDREGISSAVQVWEDKFARHAAAFTWRGGEALWQERYGIWGHFSKSQPPKRSAHYWNPFGRIPVSFEKNMIVEVNPPKTGINTNVQGVIAKAPDGSRWVLHNGRLHPSSRRIKEGEFDRVVKDKRIDVRFSNRLIKGYHSVANLEVEPENLQEQMANFVINCEKVRHYYMTRPEVADQEERVALAEGRSSPENPGKYEVGPQAARTVIKKHADVWQALVLALEKRGIDHSNGRVGKYGPDLRTVVAPYILFEIKTELTASDIQKAIGQLFLYERFLEKDYRKVLVLPEKPNKETESALSALGLMVLQYNAGARAIAFNGASIAKLLD